MLVQNTKLPIRIRVTIFDTLINTIGKCYGISQVSF